MTPDKNRIIALNNLLTEIYETKEMRLSLLLDRLGFASKEVASLRKHALQLTESCIRLLEGVVFQKNKRAWTVLVHRFGLDGQAPQTLQQIGEILCITRERVRQIEKKALQRTELAAWETAVKQLVTVLLSREEAPEKIPVPETEPNPFRFEIEDAAGETTLVIRDTRTPGAAVPLTRDLFGIFYRDFTASIKKAGFNKEIHADRIAEIRKTYPRAYEPWTAEEEETLMQEYRAGADIEELVAMLERQPGAIRSRIEKLA